MSYTQAVCTDISNSVFRLHVIANSDSDEDQNLKYIVRDSVINYIHEISQNASSKSEVIEIAKNHIEEIKSIAEKTVKDNGYNYNINVSVGNFAFPIKQYGDITLPPGYYDALKIEIGEAKGKNWWCVMFPPLCFVDISSGVVPENSKDLLENTLSEEEYALVSDNSDMKVKFKFKLLEFFTESGIITAKK